MIRFRFRFPKSQIVPWANGYDIDSDALLENGIGPAVKQQGFLTRDQFLELTRWKTSRSKSRCRRNDDDFIKEATRAALTSDNERFKIEALRLLDGVEWPTASVILHFCDRGKYPILDVRALWSLGIDTPPPYEFNFWKDYVMFLRRVSDESRLPMRVLDRALWQFSKMNQK